MSDKILECPKCKCRNIIVHETIEAISEHRIIDGIWDHSYDANEYGNAINTICLCSNCQHRWISRRGINFDNYYIEEK